MRASRLLAAARGLFDRPRATFRLRRVMAKTLLVAKQAPRQGRLAKCRTANCARSSVARKMQASPSLATPHQSCILACASIRRLAISCARDSNGPRRNVREDSDAQSALEL